MLRYSTSTILYKTHCGLGGSFVESILSASLFLFITHSILCQLAEVSHRFISIFVFIDLVPQ
jgi:hypothetical protein